MSNSDDKNIKKDQHINYWKDQLTGASGQLNLPIDHPRSSRHSFSGTCQHFPINLQLTTKLRGLNQDAIESLPTTMLSALAALLSRCTGKDEL
ncbi:MAG: hypothetical protein GY940_34430, partial [bacterium]|nr:hypothetical protein [bacterium]